jgi:hypothetical protein
MSEPTKTPAPEWAVLYVRGAVRLGMPAQAIEQHLVSRGLSPEAANSLVMEVVEGAHRAEAPPIGESEWGRSIRLFIATALGVASLVLAYWYGSQVSPGLALLWVVPALLAIWIPEMTETLDPGWRVYLYVPGWFILVLYLGYRIFLAVTIFSRP